MKSIKFFILNILLFSTLSCQKDENYILEDTSKSITATSPLTHLISRVTQHSTTVDNVLDNSSCFSIVLPVVVTVNGINSTVATTDDYQTIKNIKDDYSNDDDVVHFNYPITIQYPNYTTQIVTSESEFNSVVSNCTENEFDEINCIFFDFPIVINSYDATNQFASSITFNNNADLYNFIEALENNVYLSINFPISLTNAEGEVTVFTSNSQLEDYIDAAVNDCDDNSNTGSTDFVETLLNETWNISYFYSSESNDTFNEYTFVFYANHTISAIKNGISIYGEWSVETESGFQKLHLEFEGSVLHPIEKEWKVTEFSNTTIKLKKNSENSQGNDYLYFTKE